MRNSQRLKNIKINSFDFSKKYSKNENSEGSEKINLYQNGPSSTSKLLKLKKGSQPKFDLNRNIDSNEPQIKKNTFSKSGKFEFKNFKIDKEDNPLKLKKNSSTNHLKKTRSQKGSMYKPSKNINIYDSK